MGLLNLFKSRWSGGNMTEEDRKRIFWYLKRKTSYTAWKREADAFDRFAEIFERQVIEEPHAPGLGDGTHWDEFYVEILRAQVLYEQALARLLQGDRSVLLNTSPGLLPDAKAIALSWNTELVNQGAQGDHFYFGKYVPDLTKAIAEYARTALDTGYFERRMTDAPAPEVWTTFWRDDFKKIPFPAILDDVPVPATEVLVRSGDPVPVFGIYEPQVKDGCMNYLLPGAQPAPQLQDSDGTFTNSRTLPVTWRLIWEDTRYLDGVVPAEERTYFPPQEKLAEPLPATSIDKPLYGITGTPCLKSGYWAVMNDLQGREYVERTKLMPEYKGRSVTWVWVAP